MVAFINQIPIKKALVDMGASVNLIQFSTLQATGISKGKIQECPMEVTGFRGRDEYTTGHIQPHSAMAEGGADSLLGLLSCSENKSFISHIIGKTVVAQTSTGPIYLSLMGERKIEWQDDTDSGKPITI